MSDIPVVSLNKLLQVQSVTGDELPYLGYIEVDLAVSTFSSDPQSILLLVIPKKKFNCDTPVLLGANVMIPLLNMYKNKFGEQFLQRTNLDSPWSLAFYCIAAQEKQLYKNNGVVAYVKSSSRDKIVIPSNKSTMIEGIIDNPLPFRPCSALIQGTQKSPLPDFVEISPVLCNFEATNKQLVNIQLSNLSTRPICINSKQILGEIMPVLPTSDNITPTTDETTVTQVNSTSVSDEITVSGTSSSHLKGHRLDQMDFSECSLTGSELHTLKQFLAQSSDVFSQNDQDVGFTNIVKHKIELSDYQPFKQRHRRIPPGAYNELRDHIFQLLGAGIIRRSHSPWSSNVVLIRKKSGDLPMCLDYRQLNARTIRDSYALPRIEEVLDSLGGNCLYSVLDMKSGYHQVEIEEQHKAFTAFTVGPLGLYEFNRLPFGLNNAPATYQQIMEDCLGDLNYSICIANTFEEQSDRLKKVFDRVGAAGMKFAPKKCHFAKSKVKYVGHVVSGKGIEAESDKIDKIRNWPCPRNVDTLRKFLGFAGYYRRFIKDFSKIARPLNQLQSPSKKKLKGRQPKSRGPSTPPWQWKESQHTAFSTLKEKLSNPPVLGYPNYDLPFEIHIDGSSKGLGAAIYQTQNGVKKVLSYASRGIKPSEKNYSAFKMAITEKYHDYLYGHKCRVYTDNNPLTYVLTSAKLDATGHRWVSAISSYDSEIHYKPGVKNTDADILSRLPGIETNNSHTSYFTSNKGQSCNLLSSGSVKAILGSHNSNIVDSLALSTEVIDTLTLEDLNSMGKRDLRSEQSKDPAIGPLVDFVRQNRKPRSNQLPVCSESRQLINEFGNLVVINGILYRKTYTNENYNLQVVIPKVCVL